jgi:signal transduction histidine kinase
MNKNFFINLSLNKKLILMMLFLSFVLTSVLTVLYARAEKAMFKEFASQVDELSKAIQVGVEEITNQGTTDEMRLYEYLQSLHTSGVKEISLINNEDDIIASTNLDKLGKPIGPKKELLINAEIGESISKAEDKGYNLVLPVIAKGEHYGYIHLKINTDYFQAVMRENMIKRVLGTLFVFGLGICIAMILSWMYTKPIHNIVYAARRTAAGDLNQAPSTDRKDEIGELTQSFNYMVQKLSEQRQLEERLRETEHLSGIGQLSRSIAHEIRNPLNFISLSVDHIKEKFRPAEKNNAEKFNALIMSIKHEIQRLNKLVEDFLDYGRPLKLDIKEVDVCNLLDDIIELIWAKAEAEKINILKNCQNSLPKLNIDPELIKTCILNVILNAFQAMPSGGTLTIAANTGNGHLSVLISDNGIGIPGNELAKVFDPFFTTKKNGLGIGLATTKRVVEEHKGKVDIKSEQGKGTMVTISLPVYTTTEKTFMPGDKNAGDTCC